MEAFSTRLTNLHHTALALVSHGKGILAADETVSTLTKRFDALQIPSTPDTRRDYRQMLLTTPGVEQFIAGVIMHDETIHQSSTDGTPLVELCDERGILVGIKVDAGAKMLAGSEQELITEGLDGLRKRLMEYRRLGARFAKWRAVIVIGDGLPSHGCIRGNADALARYAALCHEQDLVPIVEPEVLMDGSHSIERCEEVTSAVQHAVFDALLAHGVALEGIILKPNMVIAGDESPKQADVATVAAATLRTLRRHAPAAVAGIAFLSGGQHDVLATQHLDAINRAAGSKPWRLSFSYGRALQDAAMITWRGRRESVESAQRAFYHRARCNSLAARGVYSEHEEQFAGERRPEGPAAPARR